jgi:hypothetical protein
MTNPKPPSINEASGSGAAGDQSFYLHSWTSDISAQFNAKFDNGRNISAVRGEGSLANSIVASSPAVDEIVMHSR